MPITTKNLAILMSCYNTSRFPDEDDLGDLSSEEETWICETLNVRFLIRDSQVTCFTSSSPGQMGQSDSKIKALGFYLRFMKIDPASWQPRDEES